MYGKESSWFYFVVSMPFLINAGLIFTVLSVYDIFTNNDKVEIKENKIEFNQNNKIFKIISIFILAFLLISSLSTHK